MKSLNGKILAANDDIDKRLLFISTGCLSVLFSHVHAYKH